MQGLSLWSFQKKVQLHKKGLFKDWILEAKNKTTWLNRIEDFFTSCKTIDKEREKENENEPDESRSDPPHQTQVTPNPNPNTRTTPVYSTEP